MMGFGPNISRSSEGGMRNIEIKIYFSFFSIPETAPENMEKFN